MEYVKRNRLSNEKAPWLKTTSRPDSTGHFLAACPRSFSYETNGSVGLRNKWKRNGNLVGGEFQGDSAAGAAAQSVVGVLQQEARLVIGCHLKPATNKKQNTSRRRQTGQRTDSMKLVQWVTVFLCTPNHFREVFGTSGNCYELTKNEAFPWWLRNR